MNLYNREIIINNDFDGCLCGKLLTKLYGCKVTGFSNSKNKLWLVDGNSLHEQTLFIDMFTLDYESVDQHIPPAAYTKNWSPNKERNRFCFDCYTQKYPFSTYFWLLTIASEEGHNIDNFLPLEKLNIPPRMNDVIYRADDSLMNCALYKNNTKEWADYLVNRSGNNPNLRKMFDFMFLHTKEQVGDWKQKVDNHFSENYGFHGEELWDIETEESKKFLERLGVGYGNVTKTFLFPSGRTTISSKEEFDDFMKQYDGNVFSFAFVYSPTKQDAKNFSYTLKY